jgi:hypothetical protein
MNNKLPTAKLEDITTNTLVSAIAIRSVPNENNKHKRRVSNVKLEDETPFYTKPIFKTKKYDLL